MEDDTKLMILTRTKWMTNVQKLKPSSSKSRCGYIHPHNLKHYPVSSNIQKFKPGSTTSEKNMKYNANNSTQSETISNDLPTTYDDGKVKPKNKMIKLSIHKRLLWWILENRQMLHTESFEGDGINHWIKYFFVDDNNFKNDTLIDEKVLSKKSK